jgi:hypothetical protein
MLTSNQLKYIHISKTNKTGKWKSISLTNLGKTFSSNECIEIYSTVVTNIQKEVQVTHDRLLSKHAPDIIMNNQRKLLAKVTRPINQIVHTDLNPLKKQIKLFNKEIPSQ